MAQLNIWRVLCVTGLRGQDVANKLLPGLGYFVAFMIVLGGLVFNIGNVGGGALGRVLCVTGLRGQDVANKLLPGLGYFVAFMIVLGGLVFNIGNVGGGALGFNTLLGIPTEVGYILAGVLAIAVFLLKNAKSAMDTLTKVLGGVMIIVIFVVIIVVKPPMGDALKNTFVPERYDYCNLRGYHCGKTTNGRCTEEYFRT